MMRLVPSVVRLSEDGRTAHKRREREEHNPDQTGASPMHREGHRTARPVRGDAVLALEGCQERHHQFVGHMLLVLIERAVELPQRGPSGADCFEPFRQVPLVLVETRTRRT